MRCDIGGFEECAVDVVVWWIILGAWPCLLPDSRHCVFTRSQHLIVSNRVTCVLLRIYGESYFEVDFYRKLRRSWTH